MVMIVRKTEFIRYITPMQQPTTSQTEDHALHPTIPAFTNDPSPPLTPTLTLTPTPTTKAPVPSGRTARYSVYHHHLAIRYRETAH